MELLRSICIWIVQDELGVILECGWDYTLKVFLFQEIEGEQGNWDREETMYCRKSIKLMAWGNEGSMINNDAFCKDPRKRGLGCHLSVKLRDH